MSSKLRLLHLQESSGRESFDMRLEVFGRLSKKATEESFNFRQKTCRRDIGVRVPCLLVLYMLELFGRLFVELLMNNTSQALP